jgi:hypothetical protein
MDVRINEVQSRVQTLDSRMILDPQIMRQIVKACVAAIEEEQARQKHLVSERQLNATVSEND